MKTPVPWLNCILYACDMKNAVITILITIINININIIHYYLFISDSYSSEKNIIIVSSNYYYYIIIVVVIIIIIVIVVVVVVVIIIILISRFTPLYLFSSAFSESVAVLASSLFGLILSPLVTVLEDCGRDNHSPLKSVQANTSAMLLNPNKEFTTEVPIQLARSGPASKI